MSGSGHPGTPPVGVTAPGVWTVLLPFRAPLRPGAGPAGGLRRPRAWAGAAPWVAFAAHACRRHSISGLDVWTLVLTHAAPAPVDPDTLTWSLAALARGVAFGAGTDLTPGVYVLSRPVALAVPRDTTRMWMQVIDLSGRSRPARGAPRHH